MIQNSIDIQADWKRCKDAMAEHLLALAEHLSGLVNTYAPGFALKGSFEPYVAPLASDIYLEVGTPEEYGMYVECGYAAHWMPIEPLIRWVDTMQLDRVQRFIKKGFTTRARLKRKEGEKASPRERQISQIAHAIQRYKAFNPTKPQFFMRRALNEMGLIAEIVYDSMGAHYVVDVASYFQSKIDMIMRQSGMMK